MDCPLIANAKIDSRSFGRGEQQFVHPRSEVFKLFDLLDDRGAFFLFLMFRCFSVGGFLVDIGNVSDFLRCRSPPRHCDPPCSEKQAGIGPISQKPELLTLDCVSAWNKGSDSISMIKGRADREITARSRWKDSRFSKMLQLVEVLPGGIRAISLAGSLY
jgi:hypothetical protein